MNRLTDELGSIVKKRRRMLGLTIRALAKSTGVSASYISSIEVGRNPTTGRPPEPSLKVLRNLARELEVSLDQLTGVVGSSGAATSSHEHRLLYSLANQRLDLRRFFGELTESSVDQWIYIADPRDTEFGLEPSSGDGHIIAWRWPFGTGPYPNEYLVPSRIVEELKTQLERCVNDIRSKQVGLIIADNSAVMRWMINPADEIDLEYDWAHQVDRIFETVVGCRPIVNICAYQHADLEALASRIDVLDSVVQLLQTHDDVTVINDDGVVSSGTTAVQSILSTLRPDNVSTRAWNSLVCAAAPSIKGLSARQSC